MKIVILDGIALSNNDISFAPIQALGETVIYDSTPAELVAERIKDADCVMLNRVSLCAQALENASQLKWIGAFSTGYNHIDIAAASRLGIVVSNVPDYSSAAVAQMTFALLLELVAHVGDFSAAVKNGVWQREHVLAMWHYPITELAGKTLGIVGFGSIGSAVARLAAAFDMNVLVWSRTPKSGHERLRFVPLDELLGYSDVVSLHLPLTDETRGLISADRLAQMKQSAFFINTARGPIVDEQALADALNARRIAGAAVDVVSTEPIRADNPLLGAKNCVITPHIAWAPIETRARLVSLVAQNLASFLAGTPMNVVNSPNK
ncbi:MAG: D-2-hydroxyacid dehydrogenase [Acetanaerobacterium sp.]